MFSCPTCNRTYKKTNFPLANENNKSKNHNFDLEHEEPLFINPYSENPEDYIAYKGTTIYAINNNKKGETTINKIGLNRPFINKRKLDFYESCKTIFEIIENSNEEDTKFKLKQLLENSSLPSSEYSLMIKCALIDNFKY